MNVALVAPPWPLFNRPSIQLGALKGHLSRGFPDISVATFHPYLDLAAALGYDYYREISRRSLLAETVFAVLLHPEKHPAIERIFKRETRTGATLGKTGLDALSTVARQTTAVAIEAQDWSRFALVGISISLCQLTAGLYYIEEIKRRAPEVDIVVGGSSFGTRSAGALLSAVAQVDAVVCGEGEIPLSRIVAAAASGTRVAEMDAVPGVVTRRHFKSSPVVFSQLPDMNDLAAPDYDDYFVRLKALGPDKHFFPTLPVEMSRGCWWQRAQPSGVARGCAFCNLNLQWEGYRHKSAQKTADEIAALTHRHQTLSMAFMDNVMPPAAGRELFEILGRRKVDLRLFCEIRANIALQSLRAMRRAGVAEVQIGIEALSSRLLKKMNKGTTAIQNLEIIKNCEALGIKNISNLILQFPGSDSEDVAQTLRALEFARPFRPMRRVHFWLGMGSPVWQDPKAFGIGAVYNHPDYKTLVSEKIAVAVPLTVQAYRGDRVRQQRLWKPVARAMRDWKRAYDTLQREAPGDPILSYRDGGDFLIIRHRRPGADAANHRLIGTSREIYLFCQHRRTLKRILEKFPGFNRRQIRAFLQTLVTKRVMFEDNDCYLSLAVAAFRPCKTP